MNEIILDEVTLNTNTLDSIGSIAKSHVNKYTNQYNEVYRSVKQHSNSSVYIENESYSDMEQIKDEFNIKALERMILSLIKEGKTIEAKSIIKEFNNYSSPLINKWKIAFSKPLKNTNRTASLKKNEIEIESQLIAENKNNFTSQWVALMAGKLIAANDNLLELKKEIKLLNVIDDVTFLKL